MTHRDPFVRASDRWMTPGVAVAFLFIVGLVVLAVVAAVTYLQTIGKSPEPMLQLLAITVGASTSTVNMVLGMVQRKQTSRIEKHTGTAPTPAEVAVAVADEVQARIIPPAPPAADTSPDRGYDEHDDYEDRDYGRGPRDEPTGYIPGRAALPVPPLPAFPQHTRTRS